MAADLGPPPEVLAQIVAKCCCGVCETCCQLSFCVDSTDPANLIGHYYRFLGQSATLHIRCADLYTMFGSDLSFASCLSSGGTVDPAVLACWGMAPDPDHPGEFLPGEPIDLTFTLPLEQQEGTDLSTGDCRYVTGKSFAKCTGILSINIFVEAKNFGWIAPGGGLGTVGERRLGISFSAEYDDAILTCSVPPSVVTPGIPMFGQGDFSIPNPDDPGGDPLQFLSCLACPISGSGSSVTGVAGSGSILWDFSVGCYQSPSFPLDQYGNTDTGLLP